MNSQLILGELILAQPTEQAISRLARSERGQMTCKLLLDFLDSPAVRGLDDSNSEAVITLATRYLLGGGREACAVKDELKKVVDRNQWVLLPQTNPAPHVR